MRNLPFLIVSAKIDISNVIINAVQNRRDFSRFLLAGAALTALGSEQQHMFLSLNSVLVSNKVPWPDFARLAAKTGYPGTDVMLKAAMQAGVEATNQLLAELKIKPAAIDFPVEFRKDEATFRAGLADLPAQARFAAQIHCPRMVTYIMSSSDTPKVELRARYKERFSQAAKILADANVRLGLEFLGPVQFRRLSKYEFIWKMNEMLEFAKECGPNVGLLLDAWHWHHAGASTEDIIHAGRENIVHVHFDDAPSLPPEKIRDDERLLPGEGVINLTGFLQALQKIGYTDALSVEVFGRLKSVPPPQAAQMGLDASLAVFRKAGVPQG
jgi:sugar phosphate isomerase/epimerase